jgi:hypothetical protein
MIMSIQADLENGLLMLFATVVDRELLRTWLAIFGNTMNRNSARLRRRSLTGNTRCVGRLIGCADMEN